MMAFSQKIIPNLWFGRRAEEAARFYTSIFKNSSLGNMSRFREDGAKIAVLSESSAMTIEFEIERYRFVGLNGDLFLKFNPSISFLVACKTKNEVDALWAKLAERGGPTLMELGTYPFSERYGWTQDRYGLSWQVIFIGDREIKQKITPTLMFVGKQRGKAEAAVNLYTKVFYDAAIDHITRYAKGEEPDKEGTIRHARFTLEGQEFAVMDSAREHNFAFNEAISFMVECRTQEEIDYYWENLTTDGGQKGMCGWLKDKFGVSWQVALF
jgi:predicted 3-demethylubiquinone-9 3-methyltransferase (glyoxalase superfamily)